ncbi:hypothetical protein J7E55_27555 [Bacillus sp. ISL-53]|nr:hypothetical protein [Bacillus sp. ISL-53]
MEEVFFLYNILGELIDEYYNCNDLSVKEKLQCDIELLINVITICD